MTKTCSKGLILCERKRLEGILPIIMKDRVIQKTDANVEKMATVRVDVDKEDASGVKKNTLSDVVLAVTAHLQHLRHRYYHVTCNILFFFFTH